jgi:hypothetical protein
MRGGLPISLTDTRSASDTVTLVLDAAEFDHGQERLVQAKLA